MSTAAPPSPSGLPPEPGPAGRAADAAHYRSVLSHFATGITIVTALQDDRPVGVTCQSFSSLSLDPPLVALFAGASSTSWPHIRRAGVFTVNVLASDQEELCRGFARSGADKFAGVPWTPSAVGTPVLEDVLAWIDCSLESEVEAGDHIVLIGRVLDLEVVRPDAPPLLFFRGGYGRFGA